ncbi:MAG: ATP/GTP-binding protein [archaeon]|nr:ATP/GTP-binding protein [archaeon]MCP8314130.1 ATP/GTP-binding protein [archaeon]MCP8317785.1 ATP/GTP-binding protein [archaeon]
MFVIFIVGTAGSGKSLLTSTLVSWYNEKGSHAIAVNLDPGALELPYAPDVDVRNYIDLQTIMESYQLGPNGALILASDLIATKLNDLQDEIDEFRPDYVIVDTPGQVELFAYRNSGPFIVNNLRCDNRAVLFLFDALLVSTPINFVSIALLATSVQLRLGLSQISVLTKRDMIGNEIKKIMKWSSSSIDLEESIREGEEDSQYLLSSGILHELIKLGFAHELIPVSSVTREGIVELSATLANILRGGEEVED